VTNPSVEEAVSRLPDDAASAALAEPRGCPFLLAEGGGWRLDAPSRDHRCTAVSPAAALSPEKQARLCLTPAYPSCATYLASIEARGARLGTPVQAQATRWGLARTTAVIEDAGGVRSRVVGALTDRGRWPAVPAVLLLTGLIVLGLSGLRGTPASAVASPSPSRPAVVASPTPRPTARPTEAPGSPEPSAPATSAPTTAPSAAPTVTAKPVSSFRTYTVRSGDTLSAIASRFGTTSRAIAELNGITTSTILHAGDVLKIPNT
jgi:LysM repeat protein